MKANQIILALAILLYFGAAACAGPLNDLNVDILNVGGGAEPIGMGLAYSGVCDDANALFFNPAGIVRAKGLALTVKDLGNFTFGEVFPTGYGVSYGLGVSRYSVSDVEIQNSTVEFSSGVIVASVGFGLGFLSGISGWDFWKDMDLGVDAKYVLDESLKQTGQPDKSAKGSDADAGWMWRPTEWLKLSAVLNNLFTPGSGAGELKWDSGEADAIEPYTRLGFGAKLIGDRRSPIYMENNELMVASDISFRRDDPQTLVAIGAEWTHAGTYVMRIGSRSDAKDGKTVSGFTAGAGVKFGNWEADFAYSPDYLTEKPSYYFSVLYWPGEWMFVKKPEERKPAEEKMKVEKEEPTELIKINGPGPELTTDEDNIAISGSVLKPGVKVFINGNEASITKDGSFEVGMPVDLGKNTVEIRTEYEGRKTVILRKILRKARVVTPEDVKINEKVAKEIVPAEEKIAKTEVEVKGRETTVASSEEKIKTLEKKPLTEVQKKALESEKKRVEAQKKAIEEARAKIAKEKERIRTERKKVEEERAKIRQKKAPIEDLATLGVIDISPNKVYETEQPITRGELASWLTRAKGVSVPAIKRAPFPDVPVDYPYAAEIKAAVDAHFMSLYPDGKFRPNEKITRGEGADIFKRLSGR